MAAGQLTQVIDQLRTILAPQDRAGLADGDLLRRYVRERDEAAFEALVRRHGPMVMGVCRRVLHNCHDAEDAFQATFLVLVRQASSLRSPGTVGNWLYGVAYRTALDARKTAAKRRAKEAKLVQRAEAPEDAWADLRPVLDQELERLPDKYRAVLVLCDLEGKTRKEAARHLGCPEGTVASRLATARTMLTKRLTRHGLSIPGGALAVLLSQNASACVPASALFSTIRAASLFAAGRAAAPGTISVKVAALTEGVLKSMLLTKLKIATAVLVVAALWAGVGMGGLLHWTQAKQNTDARRQDQKQVAVKPQVIFFEWQVEKKKPQPEVFFFEWQVEEKKPQVEVREWQYHRGPLPKQWWQAELREYQYHRRSPLEGMKVEVVHSVYADDLSPFFTQLKKQNNKNRGGFHQVLPEGIRVDVLSPDDLHESITVDRLEDVPVKPLKGC